MNIEYEDIIKIRDCHDLIIQGFPDDLSLIDNLIKDKDDKLSREILSYLNTLFLNDVLNNEHLFIKEEMNYIYSVRDYIVKVAVEITDKEEKEFLSKKGKLTDDQIKKYSTKLPKVDKEKVESFDSGERTKTFDAGFVAGIFIGFISSTILFIILSTIGLL